MGDKTEELEKLAVLEEEYALRLDEDVRGLGNEAVRRLIMSVSYDSEKHAGLYRAVAEILRGSSLAITDIDYEQLEGSLRRHVEVEETMIREVETLLKEIDDGRARRLLLEIRADELRHHPFMRNLLELVLKREVIPEQDVWDLIWRDVPTHGHPPDPYAQPDTGA